VWHKWTSSATLWDALVEIDEEMVAAAAKAPCASCGDGALYRADYPRKPRGLCAEAEPAFARRFSLCCGADGCRRRTTPPSVRFLARKVYVGFIVVVMSVLAALGAVAAAREARGVPKRTVARWQAFWAALPSTPFWCDARARFATPIDAGALPGALLGRFDGSENDILCKFLGFIAPITVTPRAKIPRVV